RHRGDHDGALLALGGHERPLRPLLAPGPAAVGALQLAHQAIMTAALAPGTGCSLRLRAERRRQAGDGGLDDVVRDAALRAGEEADAPDRERERGRGVGARAGTGPAAAADLARRPGR